MNFKDLKKQVEAFKAPKLLLKPFWTLLRDVPKDVVNPHPYLHPDSMTESPSIGFYWSVLNNGHETQLRVRCHSVDHINIYYEGLDGKFDIHAALIILEIFYPHLPRANLKAKNKSKTFFDFVKE
jgi:hypothetical protein